jgi:hypothetical protein
MFHSVKKAQITARYLPLPSMFKTSIKALF